MVYDTVSIHLFCIQIDALKQCLVYIKRQNYVLVQLSTEILDTNSEGKIFAVWDSNKL